MNVHRTLAVSKKVLRSIKHDRRTAGFLILMPLLMVMIFGYAFGGNLEDVKVIIVDMDQGGANGSISQKIISDLSANGVLSITEIVNVESNISDPVGYAREKVSDGDVRAAIVFPENYTVLAETAAVNSSSGLPVVSSQVIIYADNSNPDVMDAVKTAIQGAVQKVSVQEFGTISPLTLNEVYVYGEEAEFIDSFAPGVMGLAIVMVTFIISIISFVQERSNRTLDRILTTPLKESEIVGGYALAFGLVAIVQSVVVLSATVLLFDVNVQGSLCLVLLILVLLGLGMQGVGFFLSSIAKNEFQALQFLPVVLFPSILLSGIFWPIEAIPEFLRPVSYVVPLTFAADGARSVMVRGWGIENVWVQIVALIVFALIMLVLSTYVLMRKED